MTKEQLAKQLDGREIGDEITAEEIELAKESGLLVIFGASDDLCELRGVIDEEVDCYNGGELKLFRDSVLPEHDEHDCDCAYCGYKSLADKAATIDLQWCKDDDYSWTYATGTIRHVGFDVMEDGKKYCRGIVIDGKDLPERPN